MKEICVNCGIAMEHATSWCEECGLTFCPDCLHHDEDAVRCDICKETDIARHPEIHAPGDKRP